MAKDLETSYRHFQEILGIENFEQRFPWIGGDLQTLRDTFIHDISPIKNGTKIKIPIPCMTIKQSNTQDYLLAILNTPSNTTNKSPIALVIMLHGLGGSSERTGLCRMAMRLINNGFAVLRVNLRGAGESRKVSQGSYSAKCNDDLFPVIKEARKLSKELVKGHSDNKKKIPLFGVGISLGGTILLNLLLSEKAKAKNSKLLLDGLVCTSSPLDLVSCSKCIELPRNRFYESWLVKRLIKQTKEDEFRITEKESVFLSEALNNIGRVSIRKFDSEITAPRWGYKNVEDYYISASPLSALLNEPQTKFPALILQALDDPWVPAEGSIKVQKTISKGISNLHVVLTKNGGHNGFHGKDGCWGDKVVERWLKQLCEDNPAQRPNRHPERL